MTERSRSVLLFILGQSNERGKRYVEALGVTNTGEPQTNLVGCPVADPIPPNGAAAAPTTGNYGSIWPKLSDYWWKRDRTWLSIKNHAVGSTGWGHHWAGESVGDGTGVPFSSSDGGFDPNSYLLGVANAVIANPTYDEYWAIMANGQQDKAEAVTEANYLLAIQNIADYLNANGIGKIFLGLTFEDRANPYIWYGDTGTPAINSAIASRDFIYKGPNLADDVLNIKGYPADSGHMNQRGYEIALQKWQEAFDDLSV